jgi:hypothetical protein
MKHFFRAIATLFSFLSLFEPASAFDSNIESFDYAYHAARAGMICYF